MRWKISQEAGRPAEGSGNTDANKRPPTLPLMELVLKRIPFSEGEERQIPQRFRCQCHGEVQCPLLMVRCHDKVCASADFVQ